MGKLDLIMIQENKELLIKDLCARLPYGVIVNVNRMSNVKLTSVSWYMEIGVDDSTNLYSISEIKPYLFPLPSMTDKDLIEFLQIKGMNLNELKLFRREKIAIVSTLSSYSRHIDWLNAHHFDYRGLIEKGLAIDATNLNIY
ncbi:MAG: hypothetical protein ACI4VC_00520 [Clostridia bacterium]